MPEIGATLREARMRARIDVSEIEAQTKIRAKYLRALENEEWSLLPGATFVKSFLRTYAQALGLDGKALVEEYRLHHERPSEAEREPIVSTPQHTRPRVPGAAPSRAYMVTVGIVAVVIVLLIVGLLTEGGSSSNKHTSRATAPSHAKSTHHRGVTRAPAGRSVPAGLAPVALSLRPTAVVYVCLIGENGRKVIPGTDLQPGESTPTYHAKHFEITLGNNSVTMFVDGRARIVPPSGEPIGYSITKAAGRRRLPVSQLPTCK
jgi:cytoskeleton protein RodZ